MAGEFDLFQSEGAAAHQFLMLQAKNGGQRASDGAQIVSETLRMHSVAQLGSSDAHSARIIDEAGSGRVRANP